MPQEQTNIFDVKDPGYISSYKDARNKIQEIERAKIVEILLTDFQENNK